MTSGAARLARSAAALATVLVSAACGNVDVLTGSYATLAEARQAGAIDRGWIPAWVPAGAHDIREAHDLDTTRRWGLFNFTAPDDAALRAAVTPGEISLDGHTCDVPRRIEWWPVMLRGRLRADQAHATGLAAYFAQQSPGLIVAVNWKQRRAYYWTDAP